MNLKTLNVSKFDTSQVTDMGSMFGGCSSLTSLDVSSFDTSQVTYMTDMFDSCSSLKFLDVSNFNTSNVTSLSGMFNGCVSLMNLDVSNFNTSKVIDFSFVFRDCKAVTKLDVSKFNTSQVTNMRYVFQGCTNLENILLGENWNFSNVSNHEYMFSVSDKAKVFCASAEQKTWLSTTKSLIDSSRVFVLVSDESVKTALNSATWGDLTDYTTIQTAEYNGATYYKIKGKADFYTL